MKKHIIKEEDILAEDKRFSEFENQDIIKEFENKFVVDGKPEWIGCNIPTKLLKDFLQKAISQIQKETYEKGRLETIKEIINELEDYKLFLRNRYGDIMDLELLEENVVSKVKSILNQLKDNEVSLKVVDTSANSEAGKSFEI